MNKRKSRFTAHVAAAGRVHPARQRGHLPCVGPLFFFGAHRNPLVTSGISGEVRVLFELSGHIRVMCAIVVAG
ncbi:hypothetical protein [Brevibacillus sp. MCWH]|uniref:hypothetical protein n=1 Tax=Brevibacillus sp. MCWH TaxID=2508871 RepID=UPI0014913F49|nr:hypothetical protein [Brevibacillus sp. MCWH]NNV03068.1 hypothetical protein [Brevibacillus sp. MCWH]